MLVFTTNVETPPLSVKEVIDALSIFCPLQKNIKLSTEVAGKGEGAANHPLAKVIVFVFTNLAKTTQTFQAVFNQTINTPYVY